MLPYAMLLFLKIVQLKMLLQVNIEPYARLFTTVLKWQKAEKTWTDGSFLELNAVQIENDINAFSRYRNIT